MAVQALRTLLLTTGFTAAACFVLAGCGARSVMEMTSYQDAGGTSDDGSTPEDSAISDAPVYDHINDINGCNPSTCGGCCDQYGNCRVGMDPNACGIGGYECTDCTAFGSSCNAGTHQCGPSTNCNSATCPYGCCTGDTCTNGTDPWACGAAGSQCSDCQSMGMSCDFSSRVCVGQPSCSPANCGGCCTSWGSCDWGGTSTSCGFGGGLCQDCTMYGLQCDPNSLQCVSSVTCDPSTCPFGCCDPYSNQCVGGMDPYACGGNGQICQQCVGNNMACQPSSTGGGICESTGKDCGSWNCHGCCDCSDPSFPCTCTDGMQAYACGSGGQVCQQCLGTNQMCEQSIGGGMCVTQPPTCDASNCGGCCDYNTWPPSCMTGYDQYACGSGGQTCSQCPASEQCTPSSWGGGTCSGADGGTTCGPATCGGCCDYSMWPPACQWGGDPWACGSQGNQCTGCPSNQTCNPTPAGTYECTGTTTDCGPWNCKGCCNNNVFPAICEFGLNQMSCGSQGQTCVSCPPGGQCLSSPWGGGTCGVTPYDGGSVCDPNTCPGCCRADGVCVQGTDDSKNCGNSGTLCQDCTLQNGTCLQGVCAGTAACPGPYGSCSSTLSIKPAYTKPSACSQVELDKVAAACMGAQPPPECGQFLLALQNSDPACGQCLWQFTGQDAMGTCVAPYLSDPCNHAYACTMDCLDTACGQCAAGQQQQCNQSSLMGTGVCSGYVQGYACYTAAVQGQASFCNWGGDYGKWLYTVGNHYCGTGSP